MTFRPFDEERDRAAVHRIWREIGWIDAGDEAALDGFLDACRAEVAEVNGAAECLVLNATGTVRHLRNDIPMGCVAGVTTSRIARKQGFASRLTTRGIARDVRDGAQIASLGMFEQGYYNQLGFGTGGYEHLVSFDPSQLRGELLPAPRVPRRIGVDDWKDVHAARLQRYRGHGACTIDPPGWTRGDMIADKKAFGLGYADGPNDTLSHFIWMTINDDVEFGPYRIRCLCWQTPAQLLELLALVRAQGDQVRSVTLCEPAGVQFQDLLHRPFHQKIITERGRFESRVRAIAYWQMRICDLPGCLEKTQLPSGSVTFNLELTDPIERWLEPDAPWRGVGGAYVVTIGTSSGAEPGHDASRPTLHASVNAFTRLWLGVRPARGLELTDDLSASPELIEEIDEVVRLPEPHPDWDF